MEIFRFAERMGLISINHYKTRKFYENIFKKSKVLSIDLPEFPFGLEPRILTRWDMHRYARQAYELGVRYIGGCCGFEAYHIRDHS